jgi:hypothetical protein
MKPKREGEAKSHTHDYPGAVDASMASQGSLKKKTRGGRLTG